MEPFSAESNSTDLGARPLAQTPVILSMVILSLTFLLGFPGNGLVLWIAGLKMRQTVNTVWFLHLTLADFLCCLSLPFSLAHLVLQEHWPYGWLLCKIIPSVIVLNMFASVFLLTAISLDRCLLVLRPIWCQNHRKVRTALVICACIWASAFILCIPVFVYRETFSINNRSVCTYNFELYGSLDFLEFPFPPVRNESLDHPMGQQPAGKYEKFDDFSLSTNDALGTLAHPHGHAPTFPRPPGDPGAMDLARATYQLPDYSSVQPAGRVPFATSSALPMDHHKTDPLAISGASVSPDGSQPFPLGFDDAFYSPEMAQHLDTDYYYVGLSDSAHHTATPLVAITFTRLVVGFLLPSSVMVVCYSLIVWRMRHSRLHKSRRKTLRVTVVVVVVFLVCWAPYHIMGVLTLYTDPETPLGGTLLSWDHVAIALASANSCFNPFLYALLGKDFRKQARQSVQGILEAAFSEEPTHTTSCAPHKGASEGNSVSTAV